MTSPAGRRPYLTVREAADTVREIEAMQGDNESAHAAEDDLIKRALREIADGHPYPRSIAATVLQAADLDYTRWYA